MIRRKKYAVAKQLSIVFFGCSLAAIAVAQQPAVKTFTNPLLKSGADPWVIQQGDTYYVTRTTGHNLQIIATKKMSELGKVQPVTIWTPPKTGNYAKEIWAPELHYINHSWYMYFAADDGNNNHHRIYVLENKNANPLSAHWVFKGKVADATNKWAIDASEFEYKGKQYLIWSGWAGDDNVSQNIYIAKLANPWTIEGNRVMLSHPQYNWEKNGSGNGLPVVNEGPEILKSPQGRLFLTYSASGCWTDDYCLGMLSLKKGGNPLNAANWIKNPHPVFTKNITNSVYGPGHNGFFTSPDGKEDWIIYHANPANGEGCGGFRSARMQKISWNKDGTPHFGVPRKTDVPIPVPSGE
ncbi:glycosyl hydrolase family 43 [Arachidicoccus ginsenosidimutans]|uniref:glycoside hydrolase family 43 protein n=1 Tax=Arachidicoccus sp. BS20 TaxID=1850526 RepID=UPI0007F06580|nr:glycoside hydrolase family 43 protein [Arachidicoccus sp. BS20]ANI90056.1 glycosyl hydrolase family 43 [Arachidicoccus sp. BS20]